MIHAAALDRVMKTLTQEARVSLSNATPQQEAVKRLEEVVRVNPYAVLFSDNTGRYIGANAAATELTGFSRRELLARPCSTLRPTDEKDVTLLWRAFSAPAARMAISSYAAATARRSQGATWRHPRHPRRPRVGTGEDL